TLAIDGNPVRLPELTATAEPAALAAPGPVTWKTAVLGATPLSWSMQIARYAPASGALTPVRELSGPGAPPATLRWDGKELDAKTADVYQLDVVVAGGLQSSSALGVLAVGGGAEEVASERLAGTLFAPSGGLTAGGRAAVGVVRAKIPDDAQVSIEASEAGKAPAIRALATTARMA